MNDEMPGERGVVCVCVSCALCVYLFTERTKNIINTMTCGEFPVITVKPRFTVPRFTVNPNLPGSLPFSILTVQCSCKTKPLFTEIPDLPGQLTSQKNGKSGFDCILERFIRQVANKYVLYINKRFKFTTKYNVHNKIPQNK